MDYLDFFYQVLSHIRREGGGSEGGRKAGRLAQGALVEAEDDRPVVEQEHHSHKGEALQ